MDCTDDTTIPFPGETPLLLAASQGKVAILTYLLDRGGDPAKPDSGGVTPLHEAAENGAFRFHRWRASIRGDRVHAHWHCKIFA